MFLFFGRKRAKGQTLLFHRIIPWRLSTDISLFLSVVISLDMKYAFHYKKKKKRLLVSLATKSLTTEANFGAARYIVAKLERSRQGEVKNVPDILDRSVSLNQRSALIMLVSLA